MGRSARGGRDGLRPRPVERIELSWDNFKLRLIAAAVFLVLGAGLLAYTFSAFMGEDPGWQVIEADSGAQANSSGDFTLLYELGAGKASATAEKRALVSVYTEAAVSAYRLFSADEGFEGVTNVYELNRRPNEILTVDDALYDAFVLLERYGDRTVYLGPVYERYNGLFHCTDDSQLVDYDPYLSEEVREEFEAAAAFANDPAAVDLRLLGNDQVCLWVSEEYLAYARQLEIERYLDFGWLTNAFAADYLARALTENGYTHGSISSYDGFARNLDGRELDYAMDLYDFADGTVYPAGVMRYRGPKNMVYLRDYPLTGPDSRRMYRLETGEVRTGYLSVEDGRCRSAVHDLIAYSDTMSCAEIALRLAPIYVADTLDAAALEALADSDIQSVRVEDRVIIGTDADLALTDLYEGYTARNK